MCFSHQHSSLTHTEYKLSLIFKLQIFKNKLYFGSAFPEPDSVSSKTVPSKKQIHPWYTKGLKCLTVRNPHQSCSLIQSNSIIESDVALPVSKGGRSYLCYLDYIDCLYLLRQLNSWITML